MNHSFGLTLYALAHRRMPVDRPVWPARPKGRLVWLHTPQAETVGVLLALARRLVEDDGLPVLLTAPSPPPQGCPGVVVSLPPADTAAEAIAFLNHWQPEVIIFSDGELRPALLHEAAQRKLPVLMVNARTPHFPSGRNGWYPGLVRNSLSAMRHILALDDDAARHLRKAGAEPDRVEPTGPMELDSAVLPCIESDRAALAQALATRPVWLASAVPEAEEGTIIAAHREALRLSHRLLLILVPQDPSRGDEVARAMESTEGWSVTRRSTGQDPDPETEVYLADEGQEFGLWYRLAPVTYLGGSLSGEGSARSPLEPAALGSAILHGPRHGAHATLFARLSKARAARMVGSGAELVQALGDLLSPDRAARQAHAAWAVASQGAEVTLRVVTLIRNILEGDG